MPKTRIYFILLVSCLIPLSFWVHANTAQASVTEVRYNLSVQFVDPKQAYYISLLEMAMSKSEPKYGPYKMTPVVIEMPQGRTIKLVESEQHLDIVWTMTSIERENQLQAVYIPLLKGLMGYRIGIIRKGDQARFNQIDSIKALKHIIIGQGSDWPDTEILQQNGFKVVSGSASQLLAMLSKARFDYFPRAIHEPWDELARSDDIELEQHLLLRYASPIYFFVNKKNTLLAERIEYGLRLAINDGSFDKLFYNHPITEGVIAKAELDKRIEFAINNPLLSPKSAELLKESQLWLTALEKISPTIPLN
ncbi:type 2 periplasmic-binding domain-containing protein [Shewanella subflava]|uniref:Solute-binding protein family 3/N-terminal domain-containing protein n=1 Tax=Shewanella subflava TaxID=2986476 RepID=A0ABT3IDV9_9GAMM|nr:hypothetical protein [Shewanella subflava]MCW3174243.1 hypothetical protein [Shewanella subflava]